MTRPANRLAMNPIIGTSRPRPRRRRPRTVLPLTYMPISQARFDRSVWFWTFGALFEDQDDDEDEDDYESKLNEGLYWNSGQLFSAF
jgi:hypothetical protein